ncbi:MAG: hypothetical protein ABIR36_02625 [Nitrospiraceae bacterium]
MNQRLCVIASRLQTLIPGSPQQTTPFNFAVGAVYALRRAEELCYVSKQDLGRGGRMSADARQICQTLATAAALPERGEWLAGYFFNDGIVRIAVAYEHLVREATGTGDNEKYDIEEVKRLGFRDGWLRAWTPVRLEMNRLKHKTQKFVDGPLLTYDEAVEALDSLVDALDRANWTPPGAATP